MELIKYMSYNFYIPFFYFIKTRLKRKVKIASWLFIYHVPILLFSYLYNDYVGFNILCVIVVIYCLYEIGYIYNDTETIKNEINPTLRLCSNELDYYEKHKYRIYLVRILIALSLCLWYAICYGKYDIFLTWLILPVFLYYNLIRSRFNLILHFILVTLRFSLPFYILSSSIMFFIASLLLFPLLNLIERCAENRFNLCFFQGFLLSNKTSGRYIYYFLIAIFLAPFCIMYNQLVSILFVCIYFLLFRLFSLKLSRV